MIDSETKKHAIEEARAEFAVLINNVCRDGSAKNLALRKLQEAALWANNAISGNE